jgi:2-hydroxycyclohexanecarboxyl-CoA dehydrogenase
LTVPLTIIRCMLVVTRRLTCGALTARPGRNPAILKGRKLRTLSEKIAIVTGAGQGIGRAIAARLAAEGATVVVSDINQDAACQAARAIGGAAMAVTADVTSAGSVTALASQAQRRFGHIDVLINNAGWDKSGRFIDSDPADWDRIIQINLYGVLNTSKAVLPIMAEQRRGTVVNIASDAGRVGSSGEAVYSAAKGGVIAFTKATAREMARYQVTANCVCPGPADTALFAAIGGDDPKLRDALVRAIPLRRLAEPADVAAAVAFLASDDAAFITGQTLSVSGGLTMS